MIPKHKQLLPSTVLPMNQVYDDIVQYIDSQRDEIAYPYFLFLLHLENIERQGIATSISVQAIGELWEVLLSGGFLDNENQRTN